MKSAFLTARAAALACAFALPSPAAWSRNAPADAAPDTSVFRAEAAAVGGSDAARGASAVHFAAPAKRDPFDTAHSRGARATDPRSSAATPPGSDPEWQPNRITLGDGGPDSFGRKLSEYDTLRLEREGPRTLRQRPIAPTPYDPTKPRTETRAFHDDGAGSRCITSRGRDAVNTSCDLR